MPTQVDGNMGNISMGVAQNMAMAAPMAGIGIQQSVTSMDGMNGGIYQDGFEGGREGAWGMMNQQGGGFYTKEFEGIESGLAGGMYDSMALPNHFLEQYYSEVRNH